VREPTSFRVVRALQPLEAMKAAVIRPSTRGGVTFNVTDYDQACREFRWSDAAAALVDERGGNIAELAVFRHASSELADKIALRWRGKRGDARDISYRELATSAKRFGNALRALGIGRGDVVLALCPRIPELYATAFGVLAIEAVFSPLFAAFGPDPISTRVQAASGAVLVTTASLYARKVAPIRSALTSLRHVIVIDDGVGIPAGTLDWRAITDARDGNLASHRRARRPGDSRRRQHPASRAHARAPGSGRSGASRASEELGADVRHDHGHEPWRARLRGGLSGHQSTAGGDRGLRCDLATSLDRRRRCRSAPDDRRDSRGRSPRLGRPPRWLVSRHARSTLAGGFQAMTTLADEVLAMLCKIAPDVDPQTVDRARPLPDQLDLDSIDYQMLLVGLSTRYAVDIKESDVPRLRSIEDLASYIESHRTRAT
jgi:acyl carrier protein